MKSLYEKDIVNVNVNSINAKYVYLCKRTIEWILKLLMAYTGRSNKEKGEKNMQVAGS